nr:MAG TPA: hypothetical protein [Caudoviricetes sp.]
MAVSNKCKNNILVFISLYHSQSKIFLCIFIQPSIFFSFCLIFLEY